MNGKINNLRFAYDIVLVINDPVISNRNFPNLLTSGPHQEPFQDKIMHNKSITEGNVTIKNIILEKVILVTLPI